MPTTPSSTPMAPPAGRISTPAAPAAPHRSSAEAGSAYLAVLLILVVLTILGLSLAVVTQTEVLIGGSEKQTTRQVYSASSGLELAATYEIVNRDAAAHQLSLGQRTESLLGRTTVIADDICTSPYLQIHVSVCNLCTMNQDTEYVAAQYGVNAVALRRGDAELASRKELGTVIAFEPFQRDIGGYQSASAERLEVPDVAAGTPIDVDPTTEVDPCEGLYIKL